MAENIEKLTGQVYKRWKKNKQNMDGEHPDEEILACFFEGRLTVEEVEKIKLHLLSCESCAEAFALSLNAESAQVKDLSEELIAAVNDILSLKEEAAGLKIYLVLKEKMLEVLRATGDILVGQELIPAPVLRSRNIRDFKDEVTILKDFQDIRLEVKIENKGGKCFGVTVKAGRKDTRGLIKDLRVTLIKDDLELESYLSDAGSVTFEHVSLGRYRLEVASPEKKLASVLLDVRV